MLLRRVQIGLMLALAMSPAAWALTPPTFLAHWEMPLIGLAVVLALVVVGLLGMEIVQFKKDRDVKRLAQAVEQQRIEALERAAAAEEAAAQAAPAVNPLMMGRGKTGEAGRPSSPPPPSMAPPPPPPASIGAPPPPPTFAPPPPPPTFAPPPPPPLPPPPPAMAGGGADSNPFARLASLANEDDAVKKVSGKANPISLPANEPPIGTESGGWADLMQKVRSAKESESSQSMPAGPPPVSLTGMRTGSGSIGIGAPPPEPPKASGGDAWEALLKKTAAANASENPFSGGDMTRSAPPEPSGNLKGVMSGLGPSAGASNPFANAAGTGGSVNPFAGMGGGAAPPPPPPPPPEPASDPDFLKRTRTISLDSSKSGESKF